MIANGMGAQIQDRALGLTRLLLVPVLIALAAGIGAVLSGGSGLIDGSAMLLFLGASALALLIFTRASRADPNGQLLMQLFALAWMARLAGMALKLYLLGVVGVGADAVAYHEEGKIVAATLGAAELPDLGQFWGTRFIELVTGLLYVVIGPSFGGGWVVFNLLGLLGMLLHYKAFALALPHARVRLFMILVFLAPSILIWTDSLGKDALIAFFLGLSAWGAALMYTRGLRIAYLLVTGLGLGGAMLVRPHIGGILGAAVFVLVVLRPVRAGALTVIVRLGIVAACIVVGMALARVSASFINLDDLSVEGVGQFLQEAQAGSQQGGLAFQGTLPATPQGALVALTTVLFRPFPWEAGNLFFLVSAFEGMILLAVLVYRFRHLGHAIWDARRNGYLAFAMVFVALFVFFFATISNFGILVRQRTQMLPFLFVLLAYQRAEGRSRVPSSASRRRDASVSGGSHAPRS